MTISFRLKEERLRLGFTQSAFAALAGATKSAQIKWESGNSSAPTAPALAAFADAGADVMYILNGRRSPSLMDKALAQDAQFVLNNLERALDHLGEEAKMRGISEEDARASIRGALTAVATNMDLAADIRTRADMLLRNKLDDDGAAERQAINFAAFNAKRERSDVDLHNICKR